MNKNHETYLPCVKIRSADSHQTYDLKELAKILAQRKYTSEENPAIKRLQRRFEKI